MLNDFKKSRILYLKEKIVSAYSRSFNEPSENEVDKLDSDWINQDTHLDTDSPPEEEIIELISLTDTTLAKDDTGPSINDMAENVAQKNPYN